MNRDGERQGLSRRVVGCMNFYRADGAHGPGVGAGVGVGGPGVGSG